ncbi:MAG: MBL fold metallo-hydrolase [Pseudomonadota bacterium]
MSPVISQPRKLLGNVFMVGGPDLSDPRDCLCYLVCAPLATVLVDCGAGPSAPHILDLAARACPNQLTHLLLTHAHIDHVGGAAEIKRRTGCQVLIHPDDAAVLRTGDDQRSAAHWYGLRLEGVAPDETVADGWRLMLSQDQALEVMHIPGHTPGSLAAWCFSEDQKVLFGQDVHGPFSPAFGSDLGQWQASMTRLLALKADVLAEGHYGVFRPAREVEEFIRKQMALHAP